jgi:RHS repeat-associated protein
MRGIAWRRSPGPGLAASFRYDASGKRIERTVNGITTGYLYDGVQAIAELRGSAIDTVYHTGLAIDEVLARLAPTGNKTLLTDALNSVIAQAGDDQGVGNFYSYSPYGETTTLGTDGGNSLQYTGRENDRTGLYFYRARYYDPVLKRFISEDPIGLAGGLNAYAYVGGNPITYMDATGLAAGAGGVGGAEGILAGFYAKKGAEIGKQLCARGIRDSFNDCTEECTKILPQNVGPVPAAGSQEFTSCWSGCMNAFSDCKKKPPQSSCPAPDFG